MTTPKITVERDPNRATCPCGWTYPPKPEQVAGISDVRQHATWHRQTGCKGTA